MSVDINWETLTGGPDGEALAETIRDFIHTRFQQINWPKLIRSVEVHSFDFGTVAPQVVLKDICEPLPDFYETENDDDGSENPGGPPPEQDHHHHPAHRHMRSKGDPRRPSEVALYETANATAGKGPFLGGTSNLGYFHMPLSAGFSGTNTPLAAVAGAHFHNGAPVPGTQQEQHHHQHSDSFSSASPPPSGTPQSRPASRDHPFFDSRRASAVLDGSGAQTPPPLNHAADRDRSPEDMQVVFHATYTGDVRLSMTAEVFLDYPMPSFVGIPLKLNITGITFDGVGILAYIKKRAHLCFLSPEDAEALVSGGGGEVDLEASEMTARPGSSGGTDMGTEKNGVSGKAKVGGLLEEIRIESEMGETGEGKQVLKNVGKIEKFVLEQVQRIFEEEFVYPSFWTFLV